MKKADKILFKVIGLRFLRAFVSGAIATAIPLTIANTPSWNDFGTQFVILLVSMTIGGINGVLQAGDKLLRWKK